MMGKGCLRFPVGADRCVCPKKAPHNGRAYTPVTLLHLFVFLFFCLFHYIVPVISSVCEISQNATEW